MSGFQHKSCLMPNSIVIGAVILILYKKFFASFFFFLRVKKKKQRNVLLPYWCSLKLVLELQDILLVRIAAVGLESQDREVQDVAR